MNVAVPLLIAALSNKSEAPLQLVYCIQEISILLRSNSINVSIFFI